MKRLAFVGTSQSDLKAFPESARRKAGFELDRVQRGLEPENWKPMTSIGSGVREIRVKEPSGAFRVVYVAVFAEAVFVLHAFRKTARRTARRDLELATVRFRELARRMTK
jgi:phage-related protein